MVIPEGMQNLEDVRELGADVFLDIDHETNEVFDDRITLERNLYGSSVVTDGHTISVSADWIMYLLPART